MHQQNAQNPYVEDREKHGYTPISVLPFSPPTGESLDAHAVPGDDPAQLGTDVRLLRSEKNGGQNYIQREQESH